MQEKNVAQQRMTARFEEIGWYATMIICCLSGVIVPWFLPNAPILTRVEYCLIGLYIGFCVGLLLCVFFISFFIKIVIMDALLRIDIGDNTFPVPPIL